MYFLIYLTTLFTVVAANSIRFINNGNRTRNLCFYNLVKDDTLYIQFLGLPQTIEKGKELEYPLPNNFRGRFSTLLLNEECNSAHVFGHVRFNNTAGGMTQYTVTSTIEAGENGSKLGISLLSAKPKTGKHEIKGCLTFPCVGADEEKDGLPAGKIPWGRAAENEMWCLIDAPPKR
ncbi:hypothetical protein GLAREA_08795 [Glarea lozoyensis ATCC 20868]|uniref:Uncharacterized protein n=1 Tax=Glarea lozoyensis (strain ATCC 20868 / MF5171) TaxID=1116229 RepID=S3DDX2_GLAL2|nr:uncharacterized protein GLAREA_08795 [Glarea lozoyensis ATCC 20868]EPE36632.1 hypothetical protein GLAREA_08795 [Glarea lozoyensis ATCC 20868]